MKKIHCLLCCFVTTCLLLGCSNQKSNTDTSIADNTNTDESNETTNMDTTLEYLLNNCTSIYLEYEYHVDTESANGDYYQLRLKDNVSQFSYRTYSEQGYEERDSDYTLAKYEDLRSLIITQNPSLYDINDYADESGKIVYETLNPAILVHGKLSPDSTSDTYLLHMENVSPIEEYFFALRDNSDVTYSENNNGSSTGYLDNESINGAPGTDSSQNDTTIITEDNNAAIASGTEITLSSTTNIRSEMDSSSSKVAVAYSGEQLTIIESYDNGWSKVQYGNKEGYIRTDLLQY